VDSNQNHWLDCLCGNIAAGELLGAQIGFRLHNEVNPSGGNVSRRTASRGFKKVIV